MKTILMLVLLAVSSIARADIGDTREQLDATIQQNITGVQKTETEVLGGNAAKRIIFVDGERVCNLFDKTGTHVCAVTAYSPRGWTADQVIEIQSTYDGEWKLIGVDQKNALYYFYNASSSLLMIDSHSNRTVIVCNREGNELLLRIGEEAVKRKQLLSL